MNDSPKKTRLPVNFHETFAPEREYIKRILDYAASGSSDTLQGIAQKTCIPTGKSSGKTAPHLKYAKSMELITIEKKGDIIKPSLKPLGLVVFKEDKFIREPLTQWILHLNLCRKWYGAEIWYRIFTGASKIFGRNFKESELEQYLQNFYGRKKRRLIGPAISMYSNDVYFGAAGCIKKDGDLRIISQAPLNSDYFRGYCSNILIQWECQFANRNQLTLTELEEETEFFASTGWDTNDINYFLDKLYSMKAVSVDRHLGSPIITKLMPAENFIKTIYDDLI